MSGVALSFDSYPVEYGLLLRASMNFKSGNADEALENFNAALPELPVELVQRIYFNVFILSNRPEGDSNFGENAIHNRLVSLTPPDNIVKARAIMEALIEHCPGAIPAFMQELNLAERCPILMDKMGNPRIIFSGHTFELSQIQELQRQQMRQGRFQTTCPMSKLTGSSQLIPNHALKDVIQATQRFEQRLQVIPLLVNCIFQENVRYTQEIEAFKERTAQNERLVEQLLLLNGNQELLRLQTEEGVRVVREQNQTLHHQHQEALRQNQEALRQNQELREQNQSLVQRVDGLLDRNQTLATENQTLATENQTLATENQTLATENQTFAAANQTLVQESQRKDHQIQDLTQNLQRERQFWAFMSQIQSRRIEGFQRVNGSQPVGASLPSGAASQPILNETASGICPVNTFLESIHSSLQSFFVKA